MDTCIEHCLPKFQFPDAFQQGLPRAFEPFRPTPEEEHAFRSAILEIRGVMQDYVFTMVSDRIHFGILREARRFVDGTIFARFDTPTQDMYNNDYGNIQLILHLDREKHLLHYTNTFEEMNPMGLWIINRSHCGATRVVDNHKDILSAVQNCRDGEVLYVRTSSGRLRGNIHLFVHERANARKYDIRFNFEHPPLSFELVNRNWRELRRLMHLYTTRGLISFTREKELSYRHTLTPGKMGIYRRLLSHRYMAEFWGNSELVELLNRLEIRNGTNTPPIWMCRVGEAWGDVLRNLYRVARGPESTRIDFAGRALTALDCDRVVAYAALEGCLEAVSDLSRRDQRWQILQGVAPPPKLDVLLRCAMRG